METRGIMSAAAVGSTLTSVVYQPRNKIILNNFIQKICPGKPWERARDAWDPRLRSAELYPKSRKAASNHENRRPKSYEGPALVW